MMGSMMAQMALLSPSAADRMSMLVSCHECSENKEGLSDDSGSPSKMLSKTYSVFELRLEDLAREHKSRGALNGFHARKIRRQPFLFFGKPSRFLRAESLHLDTERTFHLEQFRPLFFYEEGRSYAVPTVASGSPDAVDRNFKRRDADVFRGLRSRAERKTHGVTKIIFHDARHVAFHRRGETQRLPLFRKDRYDAPDRR